MFYILNSPHSVKKLWARFKQVLPKDVKLLGLGVAWVGRVQAKAEIDVIVNEKIAQNRSKGKLRLLPLCVLRFFYAAQYEAWRNKFSKDKKAVVLCWNGMGGRRQLFMLAAEHAGVRKIYVEQCPLPNYLAFDANGINYENSLPRSIGFYEYWAQQNQNKISPDWKSLKSSLVRRESEKILSHMERIDEVRPYLFCPLQVPTDTQVEKFGGWVQSVEHMLHYLQLWSQLLPNNWKIIIKEHPSSKIKFGALLKQLCQASGGRLEVKNNVDTYELLEKSQCVVTLNSSLGMQAFLFDKPVLVLGQGFYGFEPLVNVAGSFDEACAYFKQPQTLCFSSESRNLYMSYLVQEYFVQASLTQEPYIEDAEIRRVLERFGSLEES